MGELYRGPRAWKFKYRIFAIKNSVHAGPDLFEVLTWPKALISFRFEIQTDEHLSFGNHNDMIRGGEFSNALLARASNLEEIYIYGDSEGDKCGYDLANIADLRPFTNLRRVGLHLSLMMVHIADAEFCEEPLESFSRPYEILPPALDELQIEMGNDFPSSTFFASELDWEVDLRGGELSLAICEIMHNKGDRYPGIERNRFLLVQPIKLRDEPRKHGGLFGATRMFQVY
ncbi:hypothetical protein BKA65DRAFT_485263 [Rhexocercosporidium sp. MPI-PUGE-AT-0058]|nr:hypothetical protein BKA65DRAFT_485263 [Rhexocercosporidium sp. MPI-PUGE-AT-0058]